MLQVKRLGILVIYDRDGIVDDYVKYLIAELKKNLAHLVIVCNGEMQPEALQTLNSYTKDVYIRNNSGYDATAWKEVLESLFGWKRVLEFDELLLINDSFYGPFCPLEKIYNKMQPQGLDFWGITGQYPMENTFGSYYERNELPYHIQSYFINVGKQMLHSETFVDFWNSLHLISSFGDAVTNFELRFTEYFLQHGFKCNTYVDCKAFDSGRVENNYTTVLLNPYEMIVSNGCPIIKKKCFTQEYDSVLSVSVGEDLPRVMEYISENTPYDTGMIWKNLIRLCDPKMLHNALHMEYIIPSNVLNSDAKLPNNKKIAIIAHINYPELIDTCFRYLKNIPKEIDVYINTKTQENAQIINRYLKEGDFGNYKVNLIGNRGREISGFLVGCKDILMKYDYLCFVHDKRTSGNKGPAKIGQSYMYMLWENALKSKEYIINVIDLLENNPYLGVLAPPPPYHSTYFGYLGCEWTSCFERTRELSQDLGLHCVMTKEFPPLALTTTFWCKTKALKALFERGYSYEDFPEEPMPLDGTLNHAIERIFAYVAQHEGYATGIMMNDDFASLQLCNYHYMLNGILNIERQRVCGLTYREHMRMSEDTLIEFCDQYKEIYVYGTGDYATRMTRALNRHNIEFQGYVVSDGHKKCDTFQGKTIFTLSELAVSETTGIIVALDKHNQSEVLPRLELCGFRNLYLV